MYRADHVVHLVGEGRADGSFDLRAKTVRTGLVVPGLPGPFQRINARLAVAAIDLLRRQVFFGRRFRGVTAAAVRRGLINVRRNSGLRGRLELFPRSKRLILDVAHNPSGIDALVSGFQPEDRHDVIAVFGVMKDKDYRQMLRALAVIAGAIVAVSPDTPRALSAKKLRNIGRRFGIRVLHGGSVSRGTGMALRKAGPGGRVLVTGSHFVVGEALRFLRGKKT